jgi:hypothetical protein
MLIDFIGIFGNLLSPCKFCHFWAGAGKEAHSQYFVRFRPSGAF